MLELHSRDSAGNHPNDLGDYDIKIEISMLLSANSYKK